MVWVMFWIAGDPETPAAIRAHHRARSATAMLRHWRLARRVGSGVLPRLALDDRWGEKNAPGLQIGLVTVGQF